MNTPNECFAEPLGHLEDGTLALLCEIQLLLGTDQRVRVQTHLRRRVVEYLYFFREPEDVLSKCSGRGDRKRTCLAFRQSQVDGRQMITLKLIPCLDNSSGRLL
ncbi:hypothetical protein R5R35_007192 [Gryllus longicercus]|uniref:Uncharacterized protein n=1 Tax=Gryllus longicercus TaxID=2509291 RepID=A0AAN9Z7T4_9ORTH